MIDDDPLVPGKNCMENTRPLTFNNRFDWKVTQVLIFLNCVLFTSIKRSTIIEMSR
jgi:hypothetical protein